MNRPTDDQLAREQSSDALEAAIIPLHEGRPTVVELQAAEAALEQEEAQTEYAEAGTSAGGPKPHEDAEVMRLEALFNEAQDELRAAFEGSDDPMNDEAVQAAGQRAAEAQKALQEASTVAWQSLSTDEKLDALATAIAELGTRQVQLQEQIVDHAGKLTGFGNVLMRILVRAGEIEDPSAGGIVVPGQGIHVPGRGRMDVPKSRKR